jgi:hypothetical protein
LLPLQTSNQGKLQQGKKSQFFKKKFPEKNDRKKIPAAERSKG